MNAGTILRTFNNSSATVGGLANRSVCAYSMYSTNECMDYKTIQKIYLGWMVSHVY